LPRLRGATSDYITFERAEPVLGSRRFTLPSDLAGLDSDELRRAWPGWVAKRDREIQSRLQRGEEDSLVNFILFGVSFTDQPRVTPETDDRVIRARVRDFLKGIVAPGRNERLVWLKALAPAKEPEHYVLENISRYLAEQQAYQRALESAPAESPLASQVYKNRGLSLDTNFRPNYAVEQALAELKRRGALTSVQRAAVIGPGLDFTDKDHGFDYYPLQTLQPFALIDSLFRLGMAKASDLRVAVFDISPQTLNHISSAVQSRRSYTVQMALDRSRSWTPGTLDYWHKFGDRIGAPVAPLRAPPQVQNVERRAVRIRPEVVRMLDPQPLNIVLQHSSSGYDLIIGTNVFVYYDAFEQALSMLNIDSMTALGGILLSNNLLEECPGASLRSIGNMSVEYSNSADDADRVEMYSKSAFPRR